MANWAKLQEDITGLKVVKRAKHSIHFDKGNGEIVANFSGAPCHFLDGKIWKPIDTKLLLLSDGFYGCPHSDVKIHKDGRVKAGGYHNGNLIVWEKVTEQHPSIIWEGKTWNPTDAQIKQKIADGCPLVMLVDHNEGTPALDEHWVNSIPSLTDDGAIWIHDPWDNSTIRLRDRYKKPIQQFSSYRRQA